MHQAFFNLVTNPSYLIASSLPAAHEASRLPLIRIHVHPEPVKVSYSYVRETIPQLLFSSSSSKEASQKEYGGDEQPLYDIILHIGVASGRDYYTLETLAHRDKYTKKDVDGETMEYDRLWQDKLKAPEILQPSFDVEDVWRRWKAGLTVGIILSVFSHGFQIKNITGGGSPTIE